MSTTIVVPEGYHYFVGSLLLPVFVVVGQYVMVGKYRKRAGIDYPQMYAERAQVEKSHDAHLFNCAQRTHQNTLEQIPLMYIPAAITALRFPVPTAIAMATWAVGRIGYTRGYVTGDPKKRARNIWFALGQLASMGTLLSAVYTAGSWVLAGGFN